MFISSPGQFPVDLCSWYFSLMTLFLLVAEYFLQLIFCTTTNNMKLIRDIQTFLTDVQTENTWMKRHLARNESETQQTNLVLGHIVFISFLLLWTFLLISSPWRSEPVSVLRARTRCSKREAVIYMESWRTRPARRSSAPLLSSPPRSLLSTDVSHHCAFAPHNGCHGDLFTK